MISLHGAIYITQPLLCCFTSHEMQRNALISISRIGDFGKKKYTGIYFSWKNVLSFLYLPCYFSRFAFGMCILYIYYEVIFLVFFFRIKKARDDAAVGRIVSGPSVGHSHRFWKGRLRSPYLRRRRVPPPSQKAGENWKICFIKVFN
jgi:hypothetical protein